MSSSISTHKLLLLLVLPFLPFLVWAQTERSEEPEMSVESEVIEVAPTNYNNTRSNRSSISAPAETNLCDGFTCADGSCAATETECPAATGEVPIGASSIETNVCDGVTCSDGSCAATVDACNDADDAATSGGEHEIEYDILRNSSGEGSENQTGVVRDPQDDGIGDCDDSDACVNPNEVNTAQGDTVIEPNRPNHAELPDYLDVDDDGDSVPTVLESNQKPISANDYPDDDGDGYGDPTDRAQSHNSSRSNRTEGVAVDWIDPDDDTDASEVVWRAGRFVSTSDQAEAAAGKARADGEVYCWGRAEDEGGTDHAWGGGLCIATEVTDTSDDMARDRITALQVQGKEVRTWNEEERAAWRTYQAGTAEEFPELQLASHVIERTLENERIVEVRVGDDEPSDDVVFDYQPIKVRYQVQLRLFGFIPMEREIEAGITSGGDVAIEYPWYRFLSTVPEQERIRSLLTDTLDILVLVPGRAG